VRNPKKKRAYAYVSNTYEADVQKQVEYCKLWGLANDIHIVEVFIEREPHSFLQTSGPRAQSIFERECLSAWLRAVCAVKDTYALVPRYKDLADVLAAEQWHVLRTLLEANRSPFCSATQTADELPHVDACSEFLYGLRQGAQIGKYTPTYKAPPQLAPKSEKKLTDALKKVKRNLANVIAFMAYEQKLALVTIHFECIRMNITAPGEVRVLSETDISGQLRIYNTLHDKWKYNRKSTFPVLLRKYHTALRLYEEQQPLTEAQKAHALEYAGRKDANGYTIADSQYRYHMRANNLRQRKRGGRRKKPPEKLNTV